MAFPKLLQRLFTNNGAGTTLNDSILPSTLNRGRFTTMVGLGFTKDSSVTVSDFLAKLVDKGYTYGDTVTFEWSAANSAWVTDGTNKALLQGGCLVIGKLQKNTSVWTSCEAFWYPNGATGTNVYLLYAYTGGDTTIRQGVVAMAKNSSIPTKTSQLTNDSGYVTSTSGGVCPTGVILPYIGKTIPSGWLLCNGAAISRTTYKNLFNVIGTNAGAGNGSTTFNLPNCNGRFLEGTTTTSQVGTYLSAGLPNITGRVTMNRLGINEAASITNANAVNLGATYVSNDTNAPSNFYGAGWESNYRPVAIHFNASRVSSLYSSSVSAVQPAAVYTLMIIKV